MKKLLTLISAVGVGLIVSCGPSAEEKQKIEQNRLDSLAQVEEQHRQDSLLQVAEQAHQDSLAAAKAVADSMMADSLAKLNAKVNEMSKPKPKPKPKTDPKPTKPEDVKPGQGRG